MLSKKLWAKKREAEGKFLYLSLYQHLLDTKDVMNLLWNHWLSDIQKSQIQNSLNRPETAQSLAIFLAAVHDEGKATPFFEAKPGFCNSVDLDLALMEKLERVGFHGLQKFEAMTEGDRERNRVCHHSIMGECLLTEMGVNVDIASIIGAHHGKPVQYLKELTHSIRYESSYYQTEKDSDVARLWRRVQREILDWALDVSGLSSVDELPTISQPGQVLLSGLLIMADWIASNEHYFPLMELDREEAEDQEGRVAYAWHAWKHGDLWHVDRPITKETLSSRFDFSPNPVQRVFVETIANCKDPGIFILEAPMGCGKTEAALFGAEQLAYQKGCSGMFFGLPTQATSNGIFPRIMTWLGGMAAEAGENYSLRLSHGKAALNEDFRSLSSNIDLDGDASGTVTANEWFSGRKTSSLEDFVVGTVDQFLLTALKQKHLALRHLGFSRKVVIIDELHSYDAYMNVYLEEAIQWMAAYGVPVILLSATLPARKREAFLKAYVTGVGHDWDSCPKPEDGLLTDAYPLISYMDGDQIGQVKEIDYENHSLQVQVKRIETEHLLSTIEERLEGGGIIGVIVNTVRRAQKIATQCIERFGEERVELLHSQFIATDRIQREHDLLSMIGKRGKRPYQKIIIGTQVIEQSLDINLDCLFTDLAPMDLLLQRIGRLHRHRIRRPKKHEKPILYVLETSEDWDFEDGSKLVYGEYLLARTQYYLPDLICIPKDISPLVQAVYSEDALDLSPEKQVRYLAMKEKQEILFAQKRRSAQVYRIGKPRRKHKKSVFQQEEVDSLIGWLNNSTSSASEEKAAAQVRDSGESVEVLALRQRGKGYGTFQDPKDLSNSITDFETGKVIARQGLKLPNLMTNPGKINDTIKYLEAYNAKFLSDWQQSSWLRGKLGVVFPEEGALEIGQFTLRYDPKLGLMTERSEQDGAV